MARNHLQVASKRFQEWITVQNSTNQFTEKKSKRESSKSLPKVCYASSHDKPVVAPLTSCWHICPQSLHFKLWPINNYCNISSDTWCVLIGKYLQRYVCDWIHFTAPVKITVIGQLKSKFWNHIACINCLIRGGAWIHRDRHGTITDMQDVCMYHTWHSGWSIFQYVKFCFRFQSIINSHSDFSESFIYLNIIGIVYLNNGLKPIS